MIATPQNPATVVLVHGAWADGSSWSAVINRLQKQGLAVIAVQNPTTSLADDAQAVRLALRSIEGPVVLVGHSWGGTVITEAGNDPKVKALVYVAALAPDVGQSSGDLVAAYPAEPALSGAVDDGLGNLKMSLDSWRMNVAQDLPAEQVAFLSAVQTPLRASAFGDKVIHAAWAERPCWYVISTADRALSVAMQRDLARHMNAKTTEVDASHMSLLSKPTTIADVIEDAVSFVSTPQAQR